MDDAIGGRDVRFHHPGLVQEQAIVGEFHGNHFIVQSGGLLQISGNRSGNVSLDDMVCEDVNQLLLVFRFEQVLNGSLRQLGECLVGGSKDRVGSPALQGINQTCRLQGSGQGLEASGTYSCINDVFVLRMCILANQPDTERHECNNFCDFHFLFRVSIFLNFNKGIRPNDPSGFKKLKTVILFKVKDQMGQALILDILLIQGRITKLGRSAKVLVGVVGVGVIFVANLTKGQRSAVIDSRDNVTDQRKGPAH
jgi:hypothetical protein